MPAAAAGKPGRGRAARGPSAARAAGPRPVGTLSAAEARRIAVAASGLAGTPPIPRAAAAAIPRAAAAATPRGARTSVSDDLGTAGTGYDRLGTVLDRLGTVLDRLSAVQIDSVNVISRAHYLPFHSRLGDYPRALADDLVPAGRAFEYWGHEAALLPVDLHPAFRWRMDRAAQDSWGSMRRTAADAPHLLADIEAHLAAAGPRTSAEVEAALAPPTSTTTEPPGWGWNWSAVKAGLEYLFWAGRVTSAGRTTAFGRRYALVEQVIDRAILELPTPEPADAVALLVGRAAAATGVATTRDLADHFRLPLPQTREAVERLAEAGTLLPVTVEGWSETAWLDPAAAVPARLRGAALLAPFDPLVWCRPRIERVFDFAYRIEIYVPAAQRRHGYYVLPFLLGDRLVARVDLKADRARRRLLVQAAWIEQLPAVTARRVPDALAERLAVMATWLELDAIEVADRGDLAPALAVAVASRG